MSDNLSNALQALAQARADEVTAHMTLLERQSELQSHLDAMLGWHDVQRAQATFDLAKAATLQADEHARAEGLAAFTATGDKKPAAGISIAIRQRLNYVREELVPWLASHGLTTMLQPITTDLTKASTALVAMKAPILIVNEPSVRIDSDLTRYLPKWATT